MSTIQAPQEIIGTFDSFDSVTVEINLSVPGGTRLTIAAEYPLDDSADEETAAAGNGNTVSGLLEIVTIAARTALEQGRHRF